MAERDDHRWTIDGIEEGMARVEEDGARMITVPRYLLPPGAREGQVLRVTRSGGGAGSASVTLTIALDERATESALRRSKETTSAAMKASRRNDPGGDVAL